MLILLIRHGETHANVSAGSSELLTPRGRRQVAMVAKRLKQYKPQAIYCSTLQRSIDTAKEIKRFHPRVKLSINHDLREIPGSLVKPESTRSKCMRLHRARAGRAFDQISHMRYKTVIIAIHGNLIQYIITKFLKIPSNRGRFFRIDNASVTAILKEKDRCEMILLNGRKHLPKRLIAHWGPHVD